MKRRDNKAEAKRKRLERVRSEVVANIIRYCEESIAKDKLNLKSGKHDTRIRKELSEPAKVH